MVQIYFKTKIHTIIAGGKKRGKRGVRNSSACGLEATIYHTRREHANHYITDAVFWLVWQNEIKYIILKMKIATRLKNADIEEDTI